MRSHQQLRRRWLFAGALALALVLTVGASGAGAVEQDPTRTATTGDGQTLTLITGDMVMLKQLAGGHVAVTVEPAPRGSEVSFETITHDGQTYVIPSDAVPFVPDVLDRELFNVTKLADYGYHDGVPVIITYDPAMPRPQAAPQGTSLTWDLPSIDAVAVTIGPDGQWWNAVMPSRWAPHTPGGVLAGVTKVWLDELAEVLLADSVPQVGAPDAWDAGYDGTGVTVAVLDTGIDDSHPDLAGKVVAAENFTADPDTGDEHGHGTHVASTVAGTGAASGGTYTGAAPGAQLLNGKVCNRFGSCPQSGIIAGMEWAANQGAAVANLSIGGSPTDGTDPLSMAVNNLTEQHGVLFVIAAGNSGFFGDHSVTSPGSADAALTVGAVDKSDQLANFSSRGPRLGDFAIKPDLTAPGVGIIAARADGTALGVPVDDDYTQASGTSMATPHVAGAAAILLQHSPDLGWDGVKAALSSTAAPHGGLDVHQQGGGRLDIPSALHAPVLATPSPLNLGYFQYPHDEVEPVSAQVTYTNRTDQTVDLALALDVASRDGAVPGSDMLSVQPDTVSLAPGASAQVTVTVDASVGEFGLYGGYLVATSDGDVVTRTPVGFYKESERYELTVEGIARDGRPAFGISSFDVVNAVDTSVFLETSNSFTNGVASLRVPPGTYSVMGVIYTYDDPQIFVTERVAVGNPQVEVTEDTTVVLDARDANEITFDTEEPTEVLSGVSLGWYRQSEQVGSHSHIHTGLQVPQFATETAPVTLGAFEFFSRHRLAGTGVLYDLVDAHPGHIPADLHVVADKDVLATLDNRFHSDVDDHVMNEVRHFWRPWAFVSVGFTTATGVPQERTEYSFGGDTRYQQQMWAEPPFTGILVEPITFYHEGEQRVQNWFRQVMRPGVIDGGLFQASTPTTPTQDQFTVRVQEWVDSDGHWGAAHTAVDVSAFRLYEDGELIAEAARPQGGFAVSPDAAEHRLEVDVDRDAPWWSTSTSTRTGWTLPAVAPPPGQTVVVPLLEVDYRTDLDLLNTAPHPRDRSGVPTIELTVRHQPGADGAAIGGARLWISYDDGQNWRERPGIDRGDGVFEFLLDNRDPAETNGFVALRVDAWDAYGNRIEQEIVRAWQLAQR